MARHSFDMVREQHQAKARLVASGRSLSEVAHLLDTSVSQLERLALDPAFRDLVSRYRRAEEKDLSPNAFSRFSYLCAA